MADTRSQMERQAFLRRAAVRQVAATIRKYRLDWHELQHALPRDDLASANEQEAALGIVEQQGATAFDAKPIALRREDGVYVSAWVWVSHAEVAAAATAVSNRNRDHASHAATQEAVSGGQR